MLLSLPLELIFVIFDHLETYQQRLNLARLCRRFYKLLSPRLLSSIELPRCSPEYLIPLTLTFNKYRYLAKNVRCFTVGKPEPTRWVGCLVRKTLEDMIGEISHSESERAHWISQLEGNQNGEYWMALLLHLLPNLEELECFWVGNKMHCVDLMLKAIVAGKMPFVDGRPGFTGLRQVHIKLIQSGGRGNTSRKLRPFYQLPSMKVLKAQMVIGGFVPADQLPEKSSPIEHLEIVQSCMPNGCHDLIAPCKNLKSFKYSHHDSSRLDVEAFSQSLGARKDTLEELSVDRFWGVSSGTIDSKSFGSLSDYAALKRLRLSMDILVGDRLRTPLVDILPPCLESLYIADMGRDEGKHEVLVAGLCSLVKASHVQASYVIFPLLKQLGIEGTFQNPNLSSQERSECLKIYPEPSSLLVSWIYEITKELSTICFENGVSFTVHDAQIERQYTEVLPDGTP
ncbi:hypothetical protein AFCA_006046 [Aspergillus flavus]|nr:hypothetical protein AFCA_006046 [Aspergillus flavus]GMF74343.1 unnamed protein product [Aspergillus oryzae]GMF84507.1 unnamed protein product [Aspergillus oryzae]GMG11157.1 unnamed protein product [Aspergillus oryzae]GMG47460.1 unnamed protein product [Aspergillus oryzae var. brunneus]